MSRSHRRRRGLRAAVVVVVAMLVGLVGGTPVAAYDVPDNGRQTWNFHQAKVTKSVQKAGQQGTGVTIAVIDTWVDGSHDDQRGRVLAGADCTTGVCTPEQGKDDCGHGTHVAGTVAATHWGVAPKAQILPVRVLTYDKGNDECSGSTGDVAAGIRWASNHDADVINLSLAAQLPGVGDASPVTRAVQDAVDKGIVVVFAAGNNNRPVADSYGGRALIVAATGPNGSLASYSQHGQGVSIAAPGGQPKKSDCASDGSDCVISTWLRDGFAALAGTSMAAPHVSGVAALLLAQQPGRSSTDVVNRIEATARTLDGAGSGRIDAAAALGVRASPGSPTSKPDATPDRNDKKATAASSDRRTPEPTNRATAKASPKRTTRPSPPGVTPLVPSLPPTDAVSAKRADDEELPLAPLAVAVAVLGGLTVALVNVGRRSVGGP